jgi:hypothetical protein
MKMHDNLVCRDTVIPDWVEIWKREESIHTANWNIYTIDPQNNYQISKINEF